MFSAGRPPRNWSARIITLALLIGLSTARDPRGTELLSRCIRMAEPLMQNAEYVFPLSMQDINSVCRMWDGFVDCIHEYTRDFLTTLQQQEFNRAIGSSVDSVRQLCVGDSDYQSSYVAYAPCLKRVSVEDGFCGRQYRYLVDLVRGTSATDAQLCCAHHKFRDCVLERTPLQCDTEVVGSSSSIPASRFMQDLLDRSFAFLLQKCRDFVPNARDCPRTISSRPTGTGADNSGGSSYNNNNVDNSIGHNSNNNNNNLRPDATTSGLSSTTSPASTTRFTWTTKGSGLGTPAPSVNLAGNGLLEPESQQFRGGAANGKMPSLVSLVVLAAGITLMIQ